jgi:predicted TPR repeat methyltransferase
MHEGEDLSQGDAAHSSSRNGDQPDRGDDITRWQNADADRPELHLELGYSRARAGELSSAIASWSRYLELDPNGDAAQSVRLALEHASRLYDVLREHHDG